ncbi:MAG: rubredoxin [Woeseiaceae bacterium]
MTDAAPLQRELDDTARLECRICWYVYDPAAGDPVYQIEPGTPFRSLPGFWRCPECDSDTGSFVPVSA